MNRFSFLLAVLTIFFASQAQTSLSQEPADSKMQTVVIKTHFYCDHCLVCETCGQKFDQELAYAKGVRLIVVDEKAMTITVTYNTKKTNAAEIRQVISRLGFDADDVKADPAAYEKLDGCCKKQE